jgi:hypothetical protein
LRVFENRVLRRVVEPERNEMKGGWRTVGNVYSSLNIIRNVKKMISRGRVGRSIQREHGEDEKCVNNFGWES